VFAEQLVGRRRPRLKVSRRATNDRIVAFIAGAFDRDAIGAVVAGWCIFSKLRRPITEVTTSSSPNTGVRVARVI
jgi:hypothetical protein